MGAERAEVVNVTINGQVFRVLAIRDQIIVLELLSSSPRETVSAPPRAA